MFGWWHVRRVRHAGAVTAVGLLLMALASACTDPGIVNSSEELVGPTSSSREPIRPAASPRSEERAGSDQASPAGGPVGQGAGAGFAAFGDSYSAGEGTNSYLSDTDVPGRNLCHRSTVAYSQQLAARLNIASTAFAACSGAVTADMFAANNNDNRGPDGSVEPAQLCQITPVVGIRPCESTQRSPALGTDTKAVTLTIGGNDIGVAKLVETCVFGQAGRYAVGLPGRGCRYDAVTVEQTLRRVAALADRGEAVSPYGSKVHSLSSVLEAIRTVAPNAQVYIAGYPQVFQAASDADCVVGAVTDGTPMSIPLKVSAADARALDAMAENLNTTIRVAAAAAGDWATYVDPSDTFTGHGICSDSSWINRVQASVAFDKTGHSVSVTTDPGSLHPTVQGQGGYADAFVAAGFNGRR